MSPLQMERLFFTKVHVEVNEKAEHEVPAPEFEFDGVPVITQIASGVKQGQDEVITDFMVRVRIAVLNEDEVKQAPYTVDVEAQAVFHLDPAFKNTDREALVRINGSSMIIGAIRETVTQITSRSVFGPLTLPSMRIQPISAEDSGDAESED